MKTLRHGLEMLFRPLYGWDEVKDQENAWSSLAYAVFLLVVSTALQFLLFDKGGGNSSFGWQTASRIKWLTIGSIAIIAGLAVNVVVVYQFAPLFDGSKDLSSAVKLVAFSSTPYFIAAVVNSILHYKMVGALIAAYSFVLFWNGLHKIMRSPPSKRGAYFVVTTIIILLAYVVLTFTLATMLI